MSAPYDGKPSAPWNQNRVEPGMTRRSFLRASTALAGGVAAIAAALAPLRELSDFPSLSEFLQKHYKELSPEEMAQVLERISKEVERQYGLRPHLKDLKPMNGVEFVYALNLT
ncbi:MAG: twin-arginine translocation signal domain-containing protein, partial [Verrucomicrobiota bacterium]